MTDSNLARRVAADLLRIGAVSLSPEEPFAWASGLRSPIYCDNRLTLGHPEVRSRIAGGLADLVQQFGDSAEVVAGTATAGIPHAAWTADRLDLPMVYVRGQAKAHGQGRQIEGGSVEGRRVALVEDLVSTGGSSLHAVDALAAAGARVGLVVAIFSYGLPASARAFVDAGLQLQTLTGFEVLREVAAAEGRASPEAVASLDAWRRDPKAWSDAHGG